MHAYDIHTLLNEHIISKFNTSTTLVDSTKSLTHRNWLNYISAFFNLHNSQL